ncbi:MAG: hypothetical protein AB8B63_04110 [Granulosicoccus sp.]
MQQIEPDPLWDEGISSYLKGEFEKKQGPLTIEDLQHFACERAVRIGDLLETLFLMAIYGAWSYCDENGDEQELDTFALDDLYAKGRIGPDDLKDFQGVWSPVA